MNILYNNLASKNVQPWIKSKAYKKNIEAKCEEDDVKINN